MDGWKIDRENAEDDFLLRTNLFIFSLYREKGCEIELTTKKEEPVQGAAN